MACRSATRLARCSKSSRLSAHARDEPPRLTKPLPRAQPRPTFSRAGARYITSWKKDLANSQFILITSRDLKSFHRIRFMSDRSAAIEAALDKVAEVSAPHSRQASVLLLLRPAVRKWGAHTPARARAFGAGARCGTRPLTGSRGTAVVAEHDVELVKHDRLWQRPHEPHRRVGRRFRGALGLGLGYVGAGLRGGNLAGRGRSESQKADGLRKEGQGWMAGGLAARLGQCRSCRAGQHPTRGDTMGDSHVGAGGGGGGRAIFETNRTERRIGTCAMLTCNVTNDVFAK